MQAPVVPVWSECSSCGLSVVDGVVRALVVRSASCAGHDRLQRVIRIGARYAGYGSVRNVVPVSGLTCGRGSVPVWYAHAGTRLYRLASLAEHAVAVDARCATRSGAF